MRALAMVVGIAACGPSAGELRGDADQHNLSAEERAVDAFVHARALAELDRPPPMRETDATRAAPVAGELLTLPDSVAIAEASCPPHQWTSCGCLAPYEYRYFHDASGGVVIAKLVPDVHRTVVHSASCVVGCGHHVRPTPRFLRSLGAIDPARVEVVDLHYAFERVDEICEHKIYAP